MKINKKLVISVFCKNIIVGPKDLGASAHFKYQVQGPRRRVRNDRGQMERAQASRLYGRRRSYPQQATSMGEKDATSPKAVHSRIAREILGPMG